MCYIEVASSNAAWRDEDSRVRDGSQKYFFGSATYLGDALSRDLAQHSSLLLREFCRRHVCVVVGCRVSGIIGTGIIKAERKNDQGDLI